MKKVDVIIETLAMLMADTVPPVTRYACILVLAKHPGKMLSPSAIQREIGFDRAVHSTLDSGVRMGLFTKSDLKAEGSRPKVAFGLTELGRDEAVRLMQGGKETAA